MDADAYDLVYRLLTVEIYLLRAALVCEVFGVVIAPVWVVVGVVSVALGLLIILVVGALAIWAWLLERRPFRGREEAS